MKRSKKEIIKRIRKEAEKSTSSVASSSADASSSSETTTEPKSKKLKVSHEPVPEELALPVEQYQELMEALEQSCKFLQTPQDVDESLLQLVEERTSTILQAIRGVLYGSANAMSADVSMLGDFNSYLQQPPSSKFESVIERKQRTRNHPLTINDEIVQNIFSYFMLHESAVAAATCKSWYNTLRKGVNSIIHGISFLEEDVSQMQDSVCLRALTTFPFRSNNNVSILKIGETLSGSMLFYLARNFGNVKELVLDGTDKITESRELIAEFQQSIAKLFPKVERLTLTRADFGVFEAYPKLESLEIREVITIFSFDPESSARQQQIQTLLSKLKKLKIPLKKLIIRQHCPSETLMALLYLFSGTLEELQIGEATEFDKAAVLEVKKQPLTIESILSSSNLKLKIFKLEAGLTQEQTDDLLDILLNNVNSLEELHLTTEYESEATETRICACLARNDKLKKLKFSEGSKITPKIAAQIATLHELESLSISCEDISCLQHISTLPKLRKLKIIEFSTFDADGFMEISGLLKCNLLESLRIPASALQTLEPFPRLRKLKLFNSCPIVKLDSRSLQHLDTQNATIHHLVLNCPNLEIFNSNPDLISLELFSKKLSSFESSAVMNNLIRFKVSGPFVSALEVHDTLLQRGDQLVLQCPLLRKLSCNVLLLLQSASSHLSEYLKNVQELDIWESEVSIDDSIIELLNQIPLLNFISFRLCRINSPAQINAPEAASASTTTKMEIDGEEEDSKKMVLTKQNTRIKEMLLDNLTGKNCKLQPLGFAFPNVEKLKTNHIILPEQMEDFQQLIRCWKERLSILNLKSSLVNEQSFAALLQDLKECHNLKKLVLIHDDASTFNLEVKDIPSLEKLSTTASITKLENLPKLKELRICAFAASLVFTTNQFRKQFTQEILKLADSLEFLDIRLSFPSSKMIERFLRDTIKHMKKLKFVGLCCQDQVHGLIKLQEQLNSQYKDIQISLQYDQHLSGEDEDYEL